MKATVCGLTLLISLSFIGAGSAQQLGVESIWRSTQGPKIPADATSVGIDRKGHPIFVCRMKSEGAWLMGRILRGACVQHGANRDVVSHAYGVLALPSSAHWKSVRGKYRGSDTVGLAGKSTRRALCRVRRAGRIHVGTVSKRGCKWTSRRGDSRVERNYEILVDPQAGPRRNYARAVLGVNRIASELTEALANVRAKLDAKAKHRILKRLSSDLSPTVATARKAYAELERSVPASLRGALRQVQVAKLEPLFDRLAQVRERLARAVTVAVTLERCNELEQDIRRTVKMLTSDTALARRLKARQRISVLTELQTRMNRELKNVRLGGDVSVVREVEGLFRPLPSLLSDAIYHMQPWLEIGERNVLYSSYLGGLPLQKPGSASKALRRLLELFRPNDSSVAAAKAVDNWLGLMDDVAATIEQRDLPLLPNASATSFKGIGSRTFALNLKRNGFSWVETQLEPDELESGQTSRYLITPNLDWIVKRLNQKLPADVVGRVACLRRQMSTGGTFVEQLNFCDAFATTYRGSDLAPLLDKELRVLIEIHARTLNVRQCARLRRSIKNDSWKEVAARHCAGNGQEAAQAEVRSKAFNDIRQHISNGKLRAAQKALNRLKSVYPHAAFVYQLEYELKRAEQQKAEERLSALKYSRRLQSIEQSLPALEEVCVKAGRRYRRARKRMRLALRRGQDGRAARLRISHDKAFFRACGARDQVLELLNAQVTTGLVQATRVTKETAPTCLKQWSICDRNP